MKQKAALLLSVLVALLVGITLGTTRKTAASAAARQPLYYVDPMHPAYRSAKPGIAPDCGMKLVPVYAEDLNLSGANELVPAGKTHIEASARQLYGIQVVPVEASSGRETVHAYGRVAADDSLIYRVDLGTDGFVKATSGDAVGNHVRLNQHLATVYSPEFLSVAGGFLSANERLPGGSFRETPGSQQNATGPQARADRLRNLGMSEAQIEEISESKKIPEDVYVVSPTDGFIISRQISVGMRFEKHAEFYRIADLRHVWILAEVFGNQAAAFRPGATARVTLPDTSESFTAKVSDVLPEVDSETRALKARLELSNPGFKLRPGMFVDIELTEPAVKGLTVPIDAVVDTGTGKHVFVQTFEGEFSLREVATGASFADRVEILRGLKAGEQVVAAGTFLLDSETRLHGN